MVAVTISEHAMRVLHDQAVAALPGQAAKWVSEAVTKVDPEAAGQAYAQVIAAVPQGAALGLVNAASLVAYGMLQGLPKTPEGSALANGITASIEHADDPDGAFWAVCGAVDDSEWWGATPLPPLGPDQPPLALDLLDRAKQAFAMAPVGPVLLCRAAGLPPPRPGTWIGLSLHDDQGRPQIGEPWQITDSAGEVHSGSLDASGTALVRGLAPGPTRIEFPSRDISYQG